MLHAAGLAVLTSSENRNVIHNRQCRKMITRSPAIARKSRPYRLRPKPSLQLPVTKKKRFVRGDTVPCTLC